MAKTTAHLRQLLRDNRPAVWQRGYPAEIRRQVGVHVHERLRQGERLTTIARELELHPSTARHWCQRAEERASATSFLPVTVVPTRAAPSSLTLTTPDGFVIAGFAAHAELVSLLRALQ